jgi:hypothetical protein
MRFAGGLSGTAGLQDDFASLFAFNRWANSKMLDACRKLTPEQYAAEPPASWAGKRACGGSSVVK